VIMNCHQWCSIERSWRNNLFDRVTRSAFWVAIRLCRTQRRCLARWFQLWGNRLWYDMTFCVWD
jgi:superfamily I DNA and RNA helicase